MKKIYSHYDEFVELEFINAYKRLTQRPEGVPGVSGIPGVPGEEGSLSPFKLIQKRIVSGAYEELTGVSVPNAFVGGDPLNIWDMTEAKEQEFISSLYIMARKDRFTPLFQFDNPVIFHRCFINIIEPPYDGYVSVSGEFPDFALVAGLVSQPLGQEIAWAGEVQRILFYEYFSFLELIQRGWNYPNTDYDLTDFEDNRFIRDIGIDVGVTWEDNFRGYHFLPSSTFFPPLEFHEVFNWGGQFMVDAPFRVYCRGADSGIINADQLGTSGQMLQNQTQPINGGGEHLVSLIYQEIPNA